jgi:hypothetical protein
MTSPGDWLSDDWTPGKPPDEDEPPNDRDPTDDSIGGAEPIVGIPAGLLGTAIELLDLCDELFNHPGSKALHAHVATVIGRDQRADVAILRWFHDGLGITAWRLLELLEDDGIVVEPDLPGRHGLLYSP